MAADGRNDRRYDHRYERHFVAVSCNLCLPLIATDCHLTAGRCNLSLALVIASDGF